MAERQIRFAVLSFAMGVAVGMASAKVAVEHRALAIERREHLAMDLVEDALRELDRAASACPTARVSAARGQRP